MSNNIPSISFCFGAYNEEEIIFETIKNLNDGLDKLIGKGNYEILVIENGSTDNTKKILKNIKNRSLRVVYISKKGHGLAIKTAIEKARYNNVVITGADLPFGLTDLKRALKLWHKYDLIFGSKLHPKSTYYTSQQRKVVSHIYSFLLRIFLNLEIKDPQGSIFIQRKKILPLLKYCDSPNAFFTTQLAVYSQMHKLSIKEIPVSSSTISKYRASKYNVLSDGYKMFKAIMNEYAKASEIKNTELIKYENK
ncbi:MAG TPA: glycosyltransferase family 2 protein [Candidatus Woesebacteria bacterium]|nr:glycosyltransferase family 2 protein [Candidatus Woesebacteria bacterium]